MMLEVELQREIINRLDKEKFFENDKVCVGKINVQFIGCFAHFQENLLFRIERFVVVKRRTKTFSRLPLNVFTTMERPQANISNVGKPSQKNSNKSPNDELEEIRKLLRQADSIMQENIFTILRKFLSLGGTPQEVIKHLSENYRGYAQMCNLVCNWLRMTGVSDKTIQSLVEEHIKNLVIQNFNPRKADTIFDEGAVRIQLITSHNSTKTLIRNKKSFLSFILKFRLKEFINLFCGDDLVGSGVVGVSD
jgi:hypothetical protein